MEVKKKIMEKVVGNNVFNRRPPMFSCIRLRKRQQCCKPKIGGETQVTNKLSFESSKDQIRYRTMCERSIMYIAPTNSCHLLLRWALLHFEMLNLHKLSLCLRHEGLEMKLKFMTPRQAKKDQHMLKEKIEKERIEKEEI